MIGDPFPLDELLHPPARTPDVSIGLEQLVILVEFVGGGSLDGGTCWLSPTCSGCGRSIVGHGFQARRGGLYWLEPSDVPGKLIGRLDV